MRRVWVVGALLSGLLASHAATVYENYRVQPGDSVETISARFEMSADDLRSLNPFLMTGTLTPYESIVVKRSDSRGVAQPAAGGNHANGAGGIRREGPSAKVVTPDNPTGEPTAPVNETPAAAPANPAVAPQSPENVIAPVEAPESALNKNFAVGGAAGRLGEVVSDKVPIYRDTQGTGGPLYTCNKGSRLVVQAQKGRWYSVLMLDWSTGWVETQYVNLTATELVTTQQTQTANSKGSSAVQEAFRYLGVPYVWGGNGFGGIDCSGLVQQCYRKQGVKLPRVSRDQFQVGAPVSWDHLQAGDRLYFASEGRRIDHTGMYVGNGQFIHASGRHRRVVVSNLFDPRYWNIYVGAKR